MEKRDSFAKTIYSMLFDWLIKKVNETITPSIPAKGTLNY